MAHIPSTIQIIFDSCGRSGFKNPDLQRAFGFSNAACKSVYKINLVVPGFPNFFVASGQQLTDAAASAIQCVNQEGRCGYMLVRDETVFAKTFSLVHGLDARDPSKPCVVGGKWPDKAILPSDDSMPSLPEEDLAAVTVCTAVKSVDSKDNLFVIQMQPRGHGISAQEEFEAMGEILMSCRLTCWIRPGECRGKRCCNVLYLDLDCLQSHHVLIEMRCQGKPWHTAHHRRDGQPQVISQGAPNFAGAFTSCKQSGGPVLGDSCLAFMVCLWNSLEFYVLVCDSMCYNA